MAGSITEEQACQVGGRPIETLLQLAKNRSGKTV